MKPKQTAFFRRIFTPLVATGLMFAFWFSFKNQIPRWWAAIALFILVGNYAYSFYKNRDLEAELTDDRKYP